MMSLQKKFDDDSIASLNQIPDLIANAEPFVANQMRHYTLRLMGSSVTPIVEMSSSELDKFETDLIDVFKFKQWLS